MILISHTLYEKLIVITRKIFYKINIKKHMVIINFYRNDAKNILVDFFI